MGERNPLRIDEAETVPNTRVKTLRRHTFKIAKTLSMTSTAEAPVSVDAKATVVTLDSTFIRSCEDGERHLEVRVGNVETESADDRFSAPLPKPIPTSRC